MNLLGRFALGVVATLVAAELIFRVLPVSTATMTGYHHDPDLLTYPSHHTWRTSTGWDLRNPQTMRSNAWGFAAEREFVADERAVALIGDSYVEASMLDPADRPAAQLERLLASERAVYALGSPGTALLDHAQRIRFAAEKFGVRDFVLLLERSDARQSLCGSGNVHSRCLERGTLQRSSHRASPAGFVKRIARHSALAQYVGSQLKFRFAELVTATFTRANAAVDAKTAPLALTPASLAAETAAAHRMVDAVVQAFFEDAQPYLQGQLVVVVDARRTETLGSGDALIDIERARMIERLAGRGAVVIDMAPIYARQQSLSRRALVVGPYDGHLNALGVGLVMSATAPALDR